MKTNTEDSISPPNTQKLFHKLEAHDPIKDKSGDATKGH